MSPDDNLADLVDAVLPDTGPGAEEDAWSRREDLPDYLPRASPCGASWEEMDGDDLVRVCRHCRKSVYNLSGMSCWEAVAFVRETEARLCVEFSRRRDGTLITGNCPVGRRRARAGVAVGSSFAFLGAVLVGSLGNGTLGTWDAHAASLWPVLLGALLGAGFAGNLYEPRLRLLLDPWLSLHQRRTLRELPMRRPLHTGDFLSRMDVAAGDRAAVEAVRQRVAEGVTCLIGRQVSCRLVYPQDRIVADLGIGAGPDSGDTAIIIVLEQDLGITIPDQEAELVCTVEDLVHLCARHPGAGTSSLE